MDSLTFHAADVERLDKELIGPGPSVTLLSGPRGVGKTTLLARVMDEVEARGERVVHYRAPSLPDPDHRLRFTRRLTAVLPEDLVPPPGGGWSELLRAVADDVAESRRRTVLILDDVPLLAEAHGGWFEEVAGFWRRIRARSLPVHLVLAGDAPHLDDALDDDVLEPSWVTSTLELEPAVYRRVASLVPHYDPLDRLRAYGVFGGLPDRLRHLNPEWTLATNVVRLVLEPEGPLHERGARLLEPDFKNPARYASLLGALAGGGREWGELVEATPVFDSGGRMAPYLSRLEELGLVTVERSLDARPRSRNRRYRIVDPFVGFWFGAVHPHLSDLSRGRAGEVWSRAVRPALDDHMARLLPVICRDYLLHHADEALPATAREVGGLWGEGYDLEVAGTLWNGAACYGHAVWGTEPVAERVADRIDGELRRTRYRFGREGRLRLIFSTGGFTPAMRRRAARDDLVHALGMEELSRT